MGRALWFRNSKTKLATGRSMVKGDFEHKSQERYVGTGRWSRIVDLFHQAANLEPAARSVFLESMCGNDDELRRELESLLSADSLFSKLPQTAQCPTVDQIRTIADKSSKVIGTRIGRYLITGLVGQGGMGVVYRAVRDDDFHMQVAIKLLKPGNDTQAALRRFRAERQILADLQHSNIARLFDGGTTESGLPYLVMEYVDGVPLLKYAAPLSIRQRTSLFLTVCSAVQYAHECRIVHRDIKPGNILVTRDGTPKLLDFGIAKLINTRDDGTTESLFTASGAWVMTPEYASPEQVRGDLITAGTDIYSLGLVLYELLTGQRAHQIEKRAPSEIERICTQDPRKPSAIVRHLDPDLDHITMKALRKDPEDRYRSVQEFAQDLDRFLRDLPINARKDNLLYRSRKFVKRNRLGGILAGALILVIATAIWLWPRPEVKDDALVPQPLTAAQGWEGYPSFSPDGSQVAYTWDEITDGDNPHLYVKMIGSGRPIQLTSDVQPDFVPAWSPDGGTIAFGRLLHANHDFGLHGYLRQFNAIYLIPPLGGTERKLAEGYFRGTMSWSPDGTYLAVAGQDSPKNPYSVYLIAKEDGEEIRLTRPPNVKVADQDPQFSLDGRTLLFTRCRGPYACALYLLELTAGYRRLPEPRLIREENGAIFGAAWTPKGKGIVYALSDADSNPKLMRIRGLSGARPEHLTYAGERVFVPTTARLGNRLAYTQDFFDLDIWQIQPGQSPRSFVSSTRQELAGEYSPDGTRVAFSSNRSGQMNIWLCDAHGANLVQLTHFEEHTASPRWSPDGGWIVFDRHLKSGWHIFVMASDGGKVRKVTSDDADEVIPSWSRDGNWIYYASSRTGRFEIWKVSAKGGTGIQVTRNGGWVAIESPDGRSLYYTKNLDNNDEFSGLWVTPTSGGAERLLLESVWNRSFAVMEDGIYYVPAPMKDGSTSVRFHDFASGQNREIASVKQGFSRRLTVSPDRKTFLFSATPRTGANVMVVENFR